jgi:aryl-alcohol dehydrogenase-like predicted oxidoreductase
VEENVGVIPWAPIGGGFLTGKYVRGNKPSEGRLSKDTGESMWERRSTDKNFRILDEVISISKQIGKTPVQVALNWLIHKEGITSPIFGASTLEQFEENMGAVGWKLSEEDWNRLDSVSSLDNDYPHRFIEKFRRKVEFIENNH